MFRPRAACRAFASLLAVCSLGPSVARADCSDPFADPDDVLTFHLEVSPADWDTLRFAPAHGTGCDAQYPYVLARFRCGDNEPWLDIGVRRKRGDQRGRDTDHKPPLKLDFNRFVGGQRWPAEQGDLGHRKLSLNNGQQSQPGGVLPALLAEHVAWRVMREVLPGASGVAFARLFVHRGGKSHFHGTYLLLEDIDRTAIRRRFGSACGRLLKTTDLACVDDVKFDDGAPNEAASAWASWLLDDDCGDPTACAERAFDLDSLLRQEALRDVLAGGYDTPLGPNWNNFHQYEPRRGRAVFLPWDLDTLFRPYPETVDPEAPLEPGASPFGVRTRWHPALRGRYLETVCELIQGPLSASRLLAHWDAADAAVRPYIDDETDLAWSGRSPLDPSIRGSYAAEYARIREWIPRRIESVRRQLAAAGVAYEAACFEGESRPCSRSSCEGVQRCVSGTWQRCEVQPQPEVLNGVDDDCDGSIDEGFALTKEACPQGPPLAVPSRPSSGCGCTTGNAVGFIALWALALRRRHRRAVS